MILRGLAVASLLVVSGAAVACGQPAAATHASATTTKVVGPTVPTKITAFAVSNENLNVDKVGLRDGLLRPDGNRDLVFTATIDGPFDAIFVVSTNAKGEPGYGLRADTQAINEDIPPELGSVVDTGKMTLPIGVVEGGKFINSDSGSAHAGPGIHNLTFYIPNSGTLNGGSFVRAYAKVAGGTLVPGPVAPY